MDNKKTLCVCRECESEKTGGDHARQERPAQGHVKKSQRKGILFTRPANTQHSTVRYVHSTQYTVNCALYTEHIVVIHRTQNPVYSTQYTVRSTQTPISANT
jgi:hypothetical protein